MELLQAYLVFLALSSPCSYFVVQMLITPTTAHIGEQREQMSGGYWHRNLSYLTMDRTNLISLELFHDICLILRFFLLFLFLLSGVSRFVAS
jgi:hypothetical protein